MRLDSGLLIAAALCSLSCTDDPMSVGATEPEPPALASANVTNIVVTNVPLEAPGRLIPCINDGAGEVVAFSGVFTARFHVTSNGNRSLIGESGVFRLQGQGETTGTTYRWRSVEMDVAHQSTFNGQFSATITFTDFITGPGRGNGVRSRSIAHVTINANGEGTAAIDHDVFLECR
jgi:hypothetical protein